MAQAPVAGAYVQHDYGRTLTDGELPLEEVQLCNRIKQIAGH
jgi:hypothetical protein